MENVPDGPSTVAPIAKKKTLKRASFMGEKCGECFTEFKIIKDYTEYKLTCPYCGKQVKSTRILEQRANTLADM